MAVELLCEKASGDWFSRRGCDDKLCGDVIAMTCAPEVDEEESWEEARLSLRCDIVDWLLEGDTTPEVVGVRCCERADAYGRKALLTEVSCVSCDVAAPCDVLLLVAWEL